VASSYPRPVVAYLRVSTEMQDVESQWIIIQEWAKSSGVNIDERLVEREPASGAEDERSVFQELWSRVREKKVGTIVVAELSRLSRSMQRVKATGKHVGRPPKLSPEQVLETLKLYTNRTPISEIARKLRTHKSTIYRYLKRYGVIKY